GALGRIAARSADAYRFAYWFGQILEEFKAGVLNHIVESTSANHLGDQPLVIRDGYHDHRRIDASPPERLEQFEPIPAWQRHVQRNQVERADGQELEGVVC